MQDLYTLIRKLSADTAKGKTDTHGNPLADHLVKVSLASGADEIVGLLSNIFSNTDVTKDKLSSLGVSDTQLTQVQILTRQKGESLEDHVGFLLEYTKRTGDLTPLKVKVADLESGLDLRYCVEFTEDDAQRTAKFIAMLNLIRETAESEGWDV